MYLNSSSTFADRAQGAGERLTAPWGLARDLGLVRACKCVCSSDGIYTFAEIRSFARALITAASFSSFRMKFYL